jgi:hypothetical protein
MSLLSRHSTTHLLNFEVRWVGGGDEGWVVGFVINSMEDKTWGVGITVKYISLHLFSSW